MSWSPPSIALRTEPADDAALRLRAERLSQELGLPIAGRGEAGRYELLMVVTAQRLEVRVVGGPDATIVGGHGVGAELTRLDTHSPPGRSLKQPLLKAVGITRREMGIRVLDATAGLGEDAWLLASFGCEVEAVERQPIIAALLDDALQRAAAGDAIVASRLTVTAADSFARLEALRDSPQPLRPQVVYVDPMFPEPIGGRRAAERKPMKVLRRLAGDDPDAAELLAAARGTALRRVVVKRPLHAPDLAPGVVARHEGKGHRFDVYSTAIPG
jgi:16S rRNA (guanine1516-N2)-methyltransferase